MTCMDSRIDPLRMLGLQPGDAKIVRNPGGRVTPAAMEALVLGVNLLSVPDPDRRAHQVHDGLAHRERDPDEDHRLERPGPRLAAVRGSSATRRPASQDDVRMVLAHPLIPDGIAVGGFLYDVDTGLLEQLC